MLNRDIVLTVSDILSNVWGFDSGESEEVVKVTIYRLRHKVEANPSQPQLILNVPGQGYKLQVQDGGNVTRKESGKSLREAHFATKQSQDSVNPRDCFANRARNDTSIHTL